MFKVEFEGWERGQLRLAVDHGASRIVPADDIIEIVLPGGWKAVLYHPDKRKPADAVTLMEKSYDPRSTATGTSSA